jgi:O-antigen/teichoic acid export membrane protein
VVAFLASAIGVGLDWIFSPFFLVLPVRSILLFNRVQSLTEGHYYLSGFSQAIPNGMFIALIAALCVIKVEGVLPVLIGFSLSQLGGVLIVRRLFIDNGVRLPTLGYRKAKKELHTVRVLLKRYSYVFLAEMVGLTRRRADIFIVAAFLGSKDLGVYSFYLVLVGILTVLYRPISRYVLIYLKQYKVASTRDFVWAYIRSSVGIALAFSVVAIPFLVFTEQIIAYAGRPEYVVRSDLLRILVIGTVINIATGPWEESVLVLGIAELQLYTRVLGLFIAAVLYFVLTIKHGLVGVGLAQVLSLNAHSLIGVSLLTRYFLKRVRSRGTAGDGVEKGQRGIRGIGV